MKKTTIVSLAMALAVLCVLTSCTNAENDMTTATTSIYFSDGSIKNYDCDSVINPFYQLDISFSGKPNRGKASINTDNCQDIVKENFIFECENNGKLSNGGMAKIKVSYDKSAFEKAGYTVTADEKDYIVTGVDFYPTTMKEFDKEAINREIMSIADEYIQENIEDMELLYDSELDRTGWSKYGSFSYTYYFSDRMMLYNVNKNDSSQNMYYIIYELKNDIKCTQDMPDYSCNNPMKAGENDTGWGYVVIGVEGVTATSNKEFISDLDKEKVIKTGVTFTNYAQAQLYCHFGGEYETEAENFV